MVFHSSPSEGTGGIWDYALRADGSLGTIKVDSVGNDEEILTIPLQHALDFAIASTDKSVNQSMLPDIDEYPYTSQNPEQRQTTIRVRYMSGIVSLLGVAFFISIVGIIYQQVGAQASVRMLRFLAHLRLAILTCTPRNEKIRWLN